LLVLKLCTVHDIHTFDLDHSSSDILHFATSELDNVFGGVEPFPDHGPCQGRGKLVRRRESRSAALQTLVGRLRTESVCVHDRKVVIQVVKKIWLGAGD
jgi:hypothetical protein